MRTRLPRAYATRAGWSRSLAAFALALALAAVIWRRWELIDLASFELALGAAFALASIAILLALVAAVQILSSDARGLRDAIVGLALAALVLLPVGVVAAVASILPDVSIATTSVGLLKSERAMLREGEGVKVGGADLAAYPDLLPLSLELPSEDVFAIVEELVAERGWRVLERREPTLEDTSARIHAVARTAVLGFLDDVVVVVTDDDETTQVDALSASRNGRHDFGTNARRVGGLLADIEQQAIN